jgi:Holliday junction resolvase RusA-like endonuclease
MPFSLDKYEKEIQLIENMYRKQFSAAAILTTPQVALMAKFFESIASRVKHSFLQANRDVEAWLKVVMSPLEAQIWEHRAQLKKRRQSIERIHMATESLEEKVQALETMQVELAEQEKTLTRLAEELDVAISADLDLLRAAA